MTHTTWYTVDGEVYCTNGGASYRYSTADESGPYVEQDAPIPVDHIPTGYQTRRRRISEVQARRLIARARQREETTP